MSDCARRIARLESALPDPLLERAAVRLAVVTRTSVTQARADLAIRLAHVTAVFAEVGPRVGLVELAAEIGVPHAELEAVTRDWAAQLAHWEAGG